MIFYISNMKNLILPLILFLSFAANAQTKPMPTSCPDLQQKLQLIKKSFSNLQTFKKDLLPGSTYKYATSLTICGVMGEMEVFGDETEIIFKFREKDFTDDDGKLVTAFVGNFRRAVKVVFGSTYNETNGKEDDEMWGESGYYEYTLNENTFPGIRIDFPFADDHCWITFHYEK